MKVLNQQGMISLSGCIILCLLSICSLYVYKLAFWQSDSVMVFKQNLQVENCAVGEVKRVISYFQQDKNSWEENTNKVQNILDFERAIIIDEQINNLSNNNIVSKDYFMGKPEHDVYKLVVEATMKNITSQICVYLEKKGDECIVQRWER